jgi:hypothetical protein
MSCSLLPPYFITDLVTAHLGAEAYYGNHYDQNNYQGDCQYPLPPALFLVALFTKLCAAAQAIFTVYLPIALALLCVPLQEEPLLPTTAHASSPEGRGIF